MSYISDVTINGSNSPISASLRGNCSTASATAAKAVNCSVFDTLKEGVSIFVTFTNDNTASNPTLNVNSTGGKAIKNGTSEIKWEAGQTVEFLYDGTYWQMSGGSGGSSFSGEEIEAIAADQIKIGNIVYTYGNQAYKALNGLNLRFDLLGYAKTSASAGENVTIESLVGSSSALFPDAEGNVF